jgi:signal transduction histidine kinase
MPAPFRDLPLGSKLVRVTTGVAAATVLLAILVVMWAELLRSRADMERDFTAQAAIIAENTTAALAFDDPQSARETLSTLAAKPHVQLGCIYRQGRLFAAYTARGVRHSCPPSPPGGGHEWSLGALELTHPIRLGDTRLGRLLLRGDLRQLYQRLRVQLLTLLGVMAVAIAFAYALATRIQRLISQPIVELAATARAVSERQDFSLRAAKHGADELGALVNAFNEMLARIERAEAERDELLAREQAARREAETANRLKDEFLATLSHELRTPLHAILGWANLLGSGKLDAATAARATVSIQRNAQAQAQLVNDILDVSSIITGKLTLKLGKVDLPRLVNAVEESLRPAAEAKRLRFSSAIEPGLGPLVGDPDRLQQVVWNLVSNAIKFTPEGGKIEIRARDTPGGTVLEVSDSGEGIAREFLPYVFDRFRQADSSTTRRHGGLGIGLSIVRHLVELHGGTVRVDSAGSGQGATFTVVLPHRTPAPQARPEAVASTGRA